MKRTTISLPDQVSEALERYQRDQEVPASLSALMLAAIREFLARRGYDVESHPRPLRITPARRGSGVGDISTEHDRYFAESSGSE